MGRERVPKAAVSRGFSSTPRASDELPVCERPRQQDLVVKPNDLPALAEEERDDLAALSAMLHAAVVDQNDALVVQGVQGGVALGQRVVLGRVRVAPDGEIERVQVEQVDGPAEAPQKL